ncbi:NAD(P)-dependent oxidoreductase [Microaerobacter geothermalis]|uniref:NAD-dependent epimerase/dehydratase family protein n=1 Tax=Microaerobacter geothermalis TaxID=674972 RepID=UPI001F43FAAC|nr:NAD(P)-dependent oxidoreductase [Microaerobacter geothermalis]MCF6093319.1 NAD(P)-dependent oxidoreductase [Microaerobacter geothermalis]
MILVTGAAGYMGSMLIEHFSKIFDSSNLKGVDNFSAGKVQHIGDIPIQCADVSNRNDVFQIMEGVDILVHCAAVSGIPTCEKESKEAVLSNLLSVKYLLEAGRNYQLKKMIFPSSFAVYAPDETVINENTRVSPYNFYGFLKYWAEQLIISYGETYKINYLIFRQSNLCGKGYSEKNSVIHTMCNAAKNNQPLTIYGGGYQVRNFIHIRDVIHIYEQGLTKNNGIYNLAGTETKSIKEIAEEVARAAKRKLNKEIEILYKESEIKGQELTLQSLTCDISKLERDFQYSPKGTIAEAIDELLS